MLLTCSFPHAQHFSDARLNRPTSRPKGRQPKVSRACSAICGSLESFTTGIWPCFASRPVDSPLSGSRLRTRTQRSEMWPTHLGPTRAAKAFLSRPKLLCRQLWALSLQETMRSSSSVLIFLGIICGMTLPNRGSRLLITLNWMSEACIEEANISLGRHPVI